MVQIADPSLGAACSKAASARQSNVGIPIKAHPSARTSPFAYAIPTRNPVNDPGPVPTAMPRRSFSAMPTGPSTSATSSGSAEPCEAADLVNCARTLPCETTAREAVALAVSSPSTGPTPAPVARSFSALNNVRDVIEDDERHQGDQQQQSHLKRHLASPKLERLPAHPLECEEQEVPAVE